MKNVIAIAALLLCTGCSSVNSAKLWVPAWFGMEPLSDRVFVNKEMPSSERDQVLVLVSASEKQIIKYYGKATSAPRFFFCSTEECFRSFGGSTNRAKSFGQSASLFSPRGMSVSIVSHEWSHAELYSRIDSFWIMRSIPTWFDEGLAVTVSEAPEHSEAHWQFLGAANIIRPTRDELYSFKSLKDWISAVHRYGDDSNVDRKAKGEPEIYPLYSAAGHEVRSWLADAGTPRLLTFIERMRNGENFETVYREVNTVNQIGMH